MVTYVSLINWTEQGIKHVKDTVKRSEASAKLAEQMGGRITTVLWTQGPYDMIIISESPDEESAQAAILALASLGNVKTLTLRAFSAAEMTSILQKLP
jgi:uncharacterized protein with GYD domain